MSFVKYKTPYGLQLIFYFTHYFLNNFLCALFEIRIISDLDFVGYTQFDVIKTIL